MTRENNKDKAKEYSKNYRKNYYENNKDKARQYNLNRNYSITIEEYNEMLVKQDSKCLGCGIHQSELKCKLAVDHNHTTGKIRGLLCRKCNLILGNAGDSPQILDNLAKYLRNN